jgi:hypothetical protein
MAFVSEGSVKVPPENDGALPAFPVRTTCTFEPGVEVEKTAKGAAPPPDDELPLPVPAHSPLGKRKHPEVSLMPLAKVEVAEVDVILRSAV